MAITILKDSPRGQQIVPLQSEQTARREIFLNGQVSDDTVHDVTAQLLHLNTEDPAAEITLYINTPGGHVGSGLVLFDVINAIDAPVRTVCMGLAGSMGAIIFLAGERRELLPNSQILIHDPSFGDICVAGKKAHELSALVDELTTVGDTLVDIIAQRTDNSIEQVKSLTRDDTCFSAEEALTFGFATHIITRFAA